MDKDFSKWHDEKSRIESLDSAFSFEEREVWWCLLGKNIGYEQDGDENSFLRPILVIKKFNLDICLILPITSQGKSGKYYFPLGEMNEKLNTVILSQIRLIDRKRLVRKITILPEETFKELVLETIRVCFGEI